MAATGRALTPGLTTTPAGVVAGTIARHQLLVPSQRVLAAFSGGADSTALAIVLAGLGYDVVLGHVDHGMRPDSAQDAERCRELAARLGLPLAVVTVPVVVRPGTTGEAAARAARYRALGGLAERMGSIPIATGHTLDDDAETVILRVGRGGYPLGIPPRRGRIVRPLLELRRAETQEVCRQRGIVPLVDPSNADTAIARNRVRHRVLPLLGDAGVVTLAALGAAALEAKQRMEAAAAEAAPGLMVRRGAAVHADRGALAALDPAVRAAVLRRVLESLGADPSQRLVTDLAAQVTRAAAVRLDLPGGLCAASETGALIIGPRPTPAAPDPVLLEPRGETVSAAWGLRIAVEEVPVPPPSRWRTGAGDLLLDAAATTRSGALGLRSRRPGDRYRPLGAPGSRKVQDVLVDLKVARSQRDRVPIVTAGDAIAWVGGARVAHHLRLTPASRTALRITVADLAPCDGGSAGCGGAR